MKIPKSAADGPETKLSTDDLPKGKYFPNPFSGKEMLTFEEAIECIYMLSSTVRIDMRMRKH